MINKIYELIKKFIIVNYVSLIVLAVTVFLCFYELPYVIYSPGGLMPLENKIVIDGANESSGSFNLSYVSMSKGTIPMLLISYILPNWDIVPKSEVTYSDESIDELLEFERIQMKSAIASATKVAYEAAGKVVVIKNQTIYSYVTTKKAQTDVQKLDQILKINDIEINNLSEIKEIVNTFNAGDTITIDVLRDGKEKKCTAIIYEENDTKYMGITFLTTYEYDVEPNITVKTKKSEAGASGGLMYSLAIYNALVEEDITKGRTIAGTGTIESDATVGPIDGVKYKLLGAVKKKAEIFICPKENYEEAMKYKNEYNLKIDIYGVGSFNEALEVLEK